MRRLKPSPASVRAGLEARGVKGGCGFLAPHPFGSAQGRLYERLGPSVEWGTRGLFRPGRKIKTERRFMAKKQGVLRPG